MLHSTAFPFHRLPRLVCALALVLLTLLVSAVNAQTSNVVAWGNDQSGQLGDGYAPYLPHQTINLTGVTAIDAGFVHTVALKQDGAVWTWGDNQYGELGDGTTTQRMTPVQVVGPDGVGFLTGVTAIDAGWYHTVALKQDGTVWTWGDNSSGQLGDGTTTQRITPVQVVGPNGADVLTGVVAIAAGDVYTVALRQDGTVWTWGGNNNGRLGDGTTTNRATPLQVVGPNGGDVLTGVVAIAAGSGHTVALKSDSAVWTWGENIAGQLGDGTNINRTTPVQVVGANGSGFLMGVQAIAAGQYHTVALKSDGTVWTWGNNDNGQLGNGTTVGRPMPIQVVGSNGSGFLTSVTAIAAGWYHTVALKQDSTVWTWGYNNNGQLGDGTILGHSMPVQVAGSNGIGVLTGVQGVAAGGGHTVALKSDNAVWTWGGNAFGQLGDGRINVAPIPEFALMASSMIAIAEGNSYTVALKQDGTVWTWGDNSSGQLGDGTTTNRVTTVQVKGLNGIGYLTSVQAVVAGYSHTAAVKQDGTVWTWGYNYYGQLGDGTNINRTKPVQVVGPNSNGLLMGVRAVAAGGGHMAALKSDGTVWAWGNNSVGQLGNGGTIRRNTPSQVVGPNGVGVLTGVTVIAAGDNHTVILKSDGTVWSWGYNAFGQLGDGTTAQRNTPVQVKGPNGVGFLTGVQAIAAGDHYTVALKSDGTVWTWGENQYGELGDGSATNHTTPVQVKGRNGSGFLTGVTAIAAGYDYAAALKQDGTVWTWGDNQYGELGDGTTTNRVTPVQTLGIGGVGYLTGVQAIAAGGDHTVALLTPNAAVSGKVTLQGCAAPQQSITFTFRPTDGSAPFTRTQTLAADGSFSFNDIPRNTYNLAIKGAIWLQQIVAVDTTGGNVSGVAVTLPAGDANNDNMVNIGDFGLLVNAYGSNVNDGSGFYNSNADFNCDGVVDVGDFGLLVNNYGAVGDL